MVFTLSQGKDESKQGKRNDFAEHSCKKGIVPISLVGHQGARTPDGQAASEVGWDEL